MLVVIIIVFLLAVFLTSWILLVRLGHLKKEAQATELDKDIHNLNLRYSVGEFSPDEYHSHHHALKERVAASPKER